MTVHSVVVVDSKRQLTRQRHSQERVVATRIEDPVPIPERTSWVEVPQAPSTVGKRVLRTITPSYAQVSCASLRPQPRTSDVVAAESASRPVVFGRRAQQSLVYGDRHVYREPTQ